jgi:hypothetical protein
VTRPIQVALVNASGLRDADVAEGMAALQRQLSDDFAPVWQVDAELHLVPRARAFEPVRPNDLWGLVLIDDAEVEKELGPGRIRGYHDTTASGLPLARVFVNRLEPGQDWTFLASHELLEMLADPDCSAAVFRHPDASTLLFYAREVCDPCAGYGDGYEKGGRHVSDFVFPSWFQSAAPKRGVTRFDERGLIDAPFKVRKDGYIGVYVTGMSAWTLQTEAGLQLNPDELTDVGSRMERRNTADNRWLDSDMSLSP